MTAITNTVTSGTNIGIREDLENTIYRVAPEETPFTSNIGSAKATNQKHEWQTEALAAASASNAQLEGDDITSFDSPNLTTRVSNYCQIFRKTGIVSRSQGVFDLAGRDSEFARQKVMKGLEIKRDIEAAMIANRASVAESGATPRSTGGALAWLTSNTSRGASGSNGGFSAGLVGAATNGTLRTFTESLVKAVISTAFTNGGGSIRLSQAYMSGTQKQEWSAFTGVADIRAEATGNKPATIYGAADVYVSDFGSITLIPHPYGLTRDVLLVDPKMWAVGTADGIKTTQLATTGDATKFLMTAEKCLVARNQLGGAVVADVQ